jgi:hypothetical protein
LARRERWPDFCLEVGGCCGRPEQLLDATDYIDAGRIVEGGIFSAVIFEGNAPEGRGPLGRAAFLESDALDGRRSSLVLGNGVLEPVENFVGGVLQTGVGLVELAGRLGGELAELVAVGDVSKCSKDKV